MGELNDYSLWSKCSKQTKNSKTDDQIRLSSTFGYRRDTISNWYYSVKANFNTQFQMDTNTLTDQHLSRD